MKNRKYVLLQLNKIDFDTYKLMVFLVEGKNKNKYILNNYELEAYNKSIDYVYNYLKRNNYKPEIKKEGIFILNKDIKRHKILFNNLKREINLIFKWLDIYAIY